MRIDAVSIFPDYLGALDISLIGKARRDGIIDLRVHDLRDWADRPDRDRDSRATTSSMIDRTRSDLLANRIGTPAARAVRSAMLCSSAVRSSARVGASSPASRTAASIPA